MLQLRVTKLNDMIKVYSNHNNNLTIIIVIQLRMRVYALVQSIAITFPPSFKLEIMVPLVSELE